MAKFNLNFPKGKKHDVVGFGLNAVDHLLVVPHYPEPNSKLRIKEYNKLCGGQVATALTVCARMGLAAKYIGKVGSDEFGHLSVEALKQERIDISSVIMEEGAYNQYAVILIDEVSGERTILWDRDPKLSFKLLELKREDICAGKILHIDGYDVDAAIQAVRWANEEGIPVCSDIDMVQQGAAELIRDIDFLITSASFATEFTGIDDEEKALKKLREYNRGFICTTLGKEGAIALMGDAVYFAPGFKVKAVDTTGAGDIFRGAFIYALFQDWSVEETLKFANAAAALGCMKIGARSGIPRLKEVFKLAAGGIAGYSKMTGDR